MAAVWVAVTVTLTGVFAVSRVFVTPRFYFADDSEVGAFGQWWQLGDRLLSGSFPVLDPHAWQAGNYFAEGQWGLLNPLTWLIAITARWAENPVVHTTIVKIAFLMLMAGGVYLLSRSFTASAPWAAVAGVLVPLGGFTVYMDAPSWATGLFNAAVLPWVWWGLRRSVEALRSPIPYLLASFALVTFGYVFGVLILVIILVESLVRAIIGRDRGRIVRTLLASAWGALLTIVVYLPGVLTAPVTARAGLGISNARFLNADLSDLMSAAAPTATASVGAWWGPETAAPLVYVAWLLPLLPLLLPMPRSVVRRCIPLFVLLALMIVLVIGPSQVGPLRWPVRFMPYVCLAACVLVAVMATHAFPALVTGRRVGWSFALLLVTTGITFANTPPQWRSLAVVLVVQALAIVGIAFVALSPRAPGDARRTGLTAAAAVAVSGLLVVPQMLVFPYTPLPKFGVPDSVERMEAVLAEASGDAIVVGDIYAYGGVDASFDERLMGNLWYLSPTPVSSLYTVLPYSTFSRDLCMDLRGSTCADSLATLWSTDDTTGLPVADLMGVSTILAMKATFPEQPMPPEGWRLVADGDYTWLFERAQEVAGAGGVAWTGSGTEVTVLDTSGTTVTFRVDSVGNDSRVVLGRLDYPGYAISGADHASPTRGWLLTVDTSEAQPGDIVTVAFRPPGFPVMVAALALGAAAAIGWVILQRRARRRSPVPAEGDEEQFIAATPAREAEPDTHG
ncbi:hypothetical protein ASD93_09195 [Microbacterium sp. Root180]|nr:hypothetical protein ASD93_09195 [Microbacterium sp. Root180]